jgi:signal recognition particle protein
MQDKEGYTPLHIAAGYLNRGVVRVLLAAGADPELQDKQGRSALDLIVSLKENTPNTAELFTRRAALDEVAKARAPSRCLLPIKSSL